MSTCILAFVVGGEQARSQTQILPGPELHPDGKRVGTFAGSTSQGAVLSFAHFWARDAGAPISLVVCWDPQEQGAKSWYQDSGKTPTYSKVCHGGSIVLVLLLLLRTPLKVSGRGLNQPCLCSAHLTSDPLSYADPLGCSRSLRVP